MGATGAGKSSVNRDFPYHLQSLTHEKKFINLLFGKEIMQVGHATTSCTAKVQPAILDLGDRFPSLQNHRVVIVDTPGFDDAFLEDVEILRRIADWLTAS